MAMSIKKWAILLLLLCGAPAEGASILSPGVESFRREMTTIVENRCAKEAKVGIRIDSITKGDLLFAHQADELFLPASNVKLITTAVALLRLHPDYTFKTEVSTNGTLRDGALKGNLYIKGFGDPLLVSEETWMIARELKNLGVVSVEGDLIGDESFFDEERYAAGWKDLGPESYNAGISALSLNFNTVTVYVEPAKGLEGKVRVVTDPETDFIKVKNHATVSNSGQPAPSLSLDRMAGEKFDTIVVGGKLSKNAKRSHHYLNVSNPPLYFLSLFRKLLEQEGINVSGKIRPGSTPRDPHLLLTHRSRPLGQIVRDLNKFSNNFIAEQILKTMGAEIFGAPGSWEKGLNVIEEFITPLGILPQQYQLADGSGLSRLNRLSPSQLVRVLTFMYGQFEVQAEYLSSLAVIGVDGSARNRLKGTEAERKIRAKTGSLTGVASLSGYAKAANDEVLAFSIIVNGTTCETSKIIELQNQIGLAMVNFSR